MNFFTPERGRQLADGNWNIFLYILFYYFLDFDFFRGETDQERVPLNLRYLNVELITRKKCAENRFPFWIDDALICSKNPHNYGMCFGDSGGLLTVNEKLVGIITYVNSSGCAKEYPDVCVSVPYFKEWIEQNID